eukprot:scaffold31495_cov56-Phaeocystis_antarctica.AAC.2
MASGSVQPIAPVSAVAVFILEGSPAACSPSTQVMSTVGRPGPFCAIRVVSKARSIAMGENEGDTRLPDTLQRGCCRALWAKRRT